MGVLCGLFGKKRQWYYENKTKAVSERQRRKLLSVNVEYYRWRWPRLGGVKLHIILKAELGEEITHGRDSFLRFLSEYGYTLPKLKRRFTTDSNHPFCKYPNLIQGVEAQYVNHIWVADITYIWIVGDVAYLHLITDMYSHAIIGWCLSETLEAENTVKALDMAVETAGGVNLCATIHHSDRGSQYACHMYVDRLREYHIRISMTERYNPTDNAVAERVNGILKNENIRLKDLYHDMEEAEEDIARVIEFHNRVRPHMSIGMRCPMDVYRKDEPGKNLWKKNMPSPCTDGK